MRRRKYLAALGSVAAGGAFTVGTGANVDFWANRSTNVDVVTDTEGFVGIVPGDNGLDTGLVNDDDGDLSLDFETGTAGQGFNQGARTTVDDLFRVRNQTGEEQVFWIKDADEGGPLGDAAPVNFFRGPVEATGGERYRIVSRIDPVPGTLATKQRLSVTGLVPPIDPDRERDAALLSEIGLDPDDPADRDRVAKLWIEAGNPVEVAGGRLTFDGDAPVPNRPGEESGRLVLGPGEEMRVGIDVDYRNTDSNAAPDDVLDNSIQIVSRPKADAKRLATTDTEFSNSA
jgi:hypothetical protein